MSQRFFDLSDDVYVPHRWHLATPIDGQGRKVHDWDFKKGTPVHMEGRLKIPVKVAGRALDFSEAGVRIPVVHVKVASLLSEVAPGDVQFIPADIEGQPEQYLVLVARASSAASTRRPRGSCSGLMRMEPPTRSASTGMFGTCASTR
jgi:hypothetical protein